MNISVGHPFYQRNKLSNQKTKNYDFTHPKLSGCNGLSAFKKQRCLLTPGDRFFNTDPIF